MIIDINALKKIIRDNHFQSRYGMDSIFLFGSLARGENANDIDLLVEKKDHYQELIQFKKELEQITHQKVDIVIREFANPIILYRAQKDLIDVTKP